MSKTTKNSARQVSDGHHTFDELYQQRTALFCALCNLFPGIAWKSKRHFDEENDPMFDGDFIAGINTPDGVITFHIKLSYWDKFKIPELERAPHYDGYSTEAVIARIFTISSL